MELAVMVVGPSRVTTPVCLAVVGARDDYDGR